MTERFRVGVTDGGGRYRQFALVNTDRLAGLGIYFGSDPTADVVLDCAEPWHARVRREGDRYVVDTLAGTLEQISPAVFVIEDSRIELGVAARRGVRDMLMPPRTIEPHAIRPPPPLPPDPPEPPPPPRKPPIVLAAPITEQTGMAALLACIAARPRRAVPSRVMTEVLDGTLAIADSLRALFELWRLHQVDRIEIGEITLTDARLTASLPLMIKGELYGEVDVDYSERRTDLLVIGWDAGRHVAFYRDSSSIDDQPIEIDTGRGTESRSGTFGSLVARAVRTAHSYGIATDLDPFF